MKSMDFKMIMDEAVLEISYMPLEERRGGFFSHISTRITVTPERARRMLLEKVWGKSIEALNAMSPETEPMAMEKALAKLMRGNVLKENITYKKNSFRIQLANGQYRAYKQGDSRVIRACPWPAGGASVALTTGSRFADFLLRFDAEIPEMEARIPFIMEIIGAREREEKKRMIEAELKNRIITSLIDQYLKPLGLSVKYYVKDNDMISMDISQAFSAHLEVPLQQLQERLKDAGAIMGLLRITSPDE